MKAMLKASILLNLALLGGMIFVLANQREKETALTHGLTVANAPEPAEAVPVPVAPASVQSDVEAAPFRWSRLVSAKDYRTYIANLRAIGCPESTIEDIVRGDTQRAFSWERRQLNLDGSGKGPWSQAREMQLVSGLLRGQSSIAPAALEPGAKNPIGPNSDGEVALSYPLFLQDVNWNAVGFAADQRAAIAQVRQQFQSEINNLNQSPGNTANQNAGAGDTAHPSANPNPSDSTGLTQWQTALQNADDQLQALLGAQGYEAYKQQQYYAWYQPQILAGNQTINPEAFSSK
jgi:hypothetical protein